VQLGKDDLIYLPPGLPHQLKVTSATPAKVIALLTSGTLEEAFTKSAEGEGKLMHDVFAEYGVEILSEFDGNYRPKGFESIDESCIVVARGFEGDAYWLAGDTYTVRLAGESTGNQLAIVHFDIPPGGGPVPHIHGRDFEAFFIREGEVDLYADGTILTGHVDDVAVLPINIPHCFKNRTERRAQMLAVVAPAGFDRFIAEVGIPVQPGYPCPPLSEDEKKRLIATAPKYKITLRPDIHF
jgi:quercetin dioxygenase-like cupin family protein